MVCFIIAKILNGSELKLVWLGLMDRWKINLKQSPFKKFFVEIQMFFKLNLENTTYSIFKWKWSEMASLTIKIFSRCCNSSFHHHTPPPPPQRTCAHTHAPISIGLLLSLEWQDGGCLPISCGECPLKVHVARVVSSLSPLHRAAPFQASTILQLYISWRLLVEVEKSFCQIKGAHPLKGPRVGSQGRLWGELEAPPPQRLP